MTASSWVGWATTLSAVLICATPPHRCALHRRQRGSSAPLLPIAALCIVVSAAHLRHSSPSLRSASSSARLICATPPHRCALHRRQRGSSAPLLPIAALCIVVSAAHLRHSSPSLRSASSSARLICATPPHRCALHRRQRGSSAPLLPIAALCIVVSAAHLRHSSPSLRSASSSARLICATPPHRCALHRRQRGSSAPLLPIAALCIVVSAAHLRHSSPSLRSASSSARLICATPPHRCALHRRQRGSSAPLLPIAALCIVVSAAHLRHSSPSLRSASSSARLICATPPHRCALHRRQRGSSAPLLPIAALCIVVSAAHLRHSSPSLRSASSSARLICATPPHRCALHRRQRGSSAPLLPIAALCIVVSAAHLRHSSASLRSASSSARLICATPPHRCALHRRQRGSSAPLLPIAALCIVVSAAHLRHSSASL